MAESEELNGTSIDLRRDQNMEAEAQVDASALALAATFGTVSFPPGTPDYLKDAILDRAELARKADAGFLIDDRMKSDGERRRGSEADDDDNLSDWAQSVRQEQMERQREREEWARTKSTVAGVAMTGAEWAQLAERLRNDSELKEDILSAFRKRGMSEEEAERRYERVADITAIAAKPESQRTEQETEDFEKAQADPSFRQDLSEANNIASMDHKASVENTKSLENSATLPPASPQPERNVALLDGPGF